MTPLNSLIFGLGLFFLGLQLIGENLRRLTGPGFHRILKSTTHSPLLGGLLGLAAGALMQSATAVTFILVSMIGSGLIKPRAAAPIVIWCNVGLTALAFVATLDIHPFVAFVVGGAGIVLGTVRIPLWKTIAGALLGMGLILIGLEQMSAGAAPLKDAAWFREAVAVALAHPPLTFLAGIAVAAILQSNTGAALLVITLAAGGIIPLQPAMLLLYGTNLGAIALRIFLASGLQGTSYRLVRLEDLFCLFSGLVMIALFLVEVAGVPLVAALADAVSGTLNTQLAVVFLLSNLIPAALLSPFLKPCARLLERIWPDRPASEDPSRPLYLSRHALDDPATALDLVARELARLLGAVRVTPAADSNDAPAVSFRALSDAIEKFAAQLAARGDLDTALSSRLHILRAELSLVRHSEEAVRYFCRSPKAADAGHPLTARLRSLLQLATEAATSLDPAAIARLHEETRLKGDALRGLQASSAQTLGDTALFEDFSVAAWTLHRLAKLLLRLTE